MTETPETHSDLPDYPWTALIVTEPQGEDEFPDSVDITRELAVLYDALIGSMDWGSQMLDQEAVEAVLKVAKICGFTSGSYRTGAGITVDLLDETGKPLTYESYSYEALSADGARYEVSLRKDKPGIAHVLRMLRALTYEERCKLAGDTRPRADTPRYVPAGAILLPESFVIGPGYRIIDLTFTRDDVGTGGQVLTIGYRE